MSSQAERRPAPRQKRRGTLAHEAAMAVLVATAVAAAVAQLMATTLQQQRALERRVFAMREAANTMEEFVAHPWESLVPGQRHQPPLSSDCSSRLPEAQLEVSVAEDDHGGRQIHVRLDWQTPEGNRTEPVQLLAWRYPPLETPP